MPLAFPSHQGLILPLWWRWPDRFDPVALCVGAAMPDIVDALAWPIRGELGQGIGHSLVGVVLLSTPLGYALTVLLRNTLPKTWIERLVPPSSSRLRGDHDEHDAEQLQEEPGRRRPSSIAISVSSVGIGALSHVVFDFVTHANFVLLLPWYRDDDGDFFPAWWQTKWFELPLLVYKKPYPIGPHFIVWCVLSVVGVLFFLRSIRRRRPRQTPK